MPETPDIAKKKQEQLLHARRINEGIAQTACRRRTVYIVLTIASVLAGVVLVIVGQYVFGLCGIGLAAVFGQQVLDAHGHLQEIRHRPVGVLAPRISEFLQPSSSEGTPNVAKRQS